MTIFLDADGVLVDLMGAVHKVLVPNADTYNWQGHYTFESINHPNMTEKQVSSLLALPGFWETVEPFTWAKELISLCREYTNEVYILTSPDKFSASGYAKLELGTKLLGNRNVVVTKHKHLLAKADDFTFLIDDKLENLKAFGVYGIHFPDQYTLIHNPSKVDEFFKHLRHRFDSILQTFPNPK